MAFLRIFILILLFGPANLQAADRLIELSDQSSVKVYLFLPAEAGAGPWPLAVLIPAGQGQEFIAKAQFWMGKELTDRGWAIAVPIPPDSSSFGGESGSKIPEVIAILQQDAEIKSGKTLLVGVSTGGSSALEIASKSPENFLAVVAVPGRIKNAAALPPLHGLPVFLRIAENDYFRWHKSLPRMVAQLTAAGAKVNAALVAEGRHTFTINWEELDPWLNSLK